MLELLLHSINMQFNTLYAVCVKTLFNICTLFQIYRNLEDIKQATDLFCSSSKIFSDEHMIFSWNDRVMSCLENSCSFRTSPDLHRGLILKS